jgi:uncharacterized protein with von Willebrand factor type A (vWA) domain
MTQRDDQAGAEIHQSGHANTSPQPRHAAGVVHAYQQYDPKAFPSPTAPVGNGDASAAIMDHLLAYGDLDELTEEQLANAIRLDPSMFPSLGPSLASLKRILLERRAKILSTFTLDQTLMEADKAWDKAAKRANPPAKMSDKLRKAFDRAVQNRALDEIADVYDRLGDDQSSFAQDLMRLLSAGANQTQVEQLADAYTFTGKQDATIDEALEIKQELEQIEELLKQLEEAQKNAQIAIIDMEAMSEYAEPGEMENLNKIGEQIREYLRQQMEQAGLEKTKDGFKLNAPGLRNLQKALLAEIFSDLQAARTGRHNVGLAGDGPIETERTRPYEFGDQASSMDVVQTLVNRSIRKQGGSAAEFDSGDIAIRQTRNNPKCATSVIMDMSGSMRYSGQYVQVKRMALALDGLIRSEYPGDHLSFFEMYSLAKMVPSAEIPALLPKPVSIHSPRVRLKADMSDPQVTEFQLPQHFTNIQHALELSRRMLSGQNTPNKQIILITDGLPTAHFEGKDLYFLYPPDPRTEEATLRQAAACAREGITINIFLLSSWNQSSEDIAFAQTLAEQTKGRVAFIAGSGLDRAVVWDYVKGRRRMIG